MNFGPGPSLAKLFSKASLNSPRISKSVLLLKLEKKIRINLHEL